MYSTKSVAVTQEETSQQQTKLYFTARKPKCRRLPEIRLLILYTSQVKTFPVELLIVYRRPDR